jgi:polysaccharide deacetylase 2 family uncharacterized protein YibQ
MFKRSIVLGVLLGFSSWSLAGADEIDVTQKDLLPFPKLDQVPSNTQTKGMFPFVLPAPEASHPWPPLFKKPSKEEVVQSTAADPVISPSAMSEMDALPKPPKIAVVIDDVGYNRRGMDASLALPLPVVLAILPETPYAKKAAKKARLQERVIILHAPMENERELKLGPGGLYVKMDEQSFKATLRADLDSVPDVTGANNHMGSLLTTHRQHMEWVMDVMAERSLFFIDSLTSAKSVAHVVATERGVPTVTRDVFLDNVRTQKAIDLQFQKLLKKAHEHGSAIAIGHPYPETTDYLQKRLNAPLSAQLVTINQLLK